MLSRILKSVVYQQKMNPTLRFGQVLLTVLGDSHPQVAATLRESRENPFYKANETDCQEALTWLADRL